MEKNMKHARDLASRGLFSQAILALGTGATQDQIDELEALTTRWQLVGHNELYRPTLERVCRAIKSGEIERTASAFRMYRDSVRYGRGPRIEDDLNGVAQSMFEVIFEPIIWAALRAEEAGDPEGAKRHLNLAEESANLIGINIPNMVDVTRKHYAALLGEARGPYSQ